MVAHGTFYNLIFAPVAQLVEQFPLKELVLSSSLSGGTKTLQKNKSRVYYIY